MHGEPLNADCGGGFLPSKAQLVFYQLLMADMFEKDAQVDAPETAQQAQGLSAGFWRPVSSPRLRTTIRAASHYCFMDYPMLPS
jgi:hypothetical protein